jgi:hypothetical protein
MSNRTHTSTKLSDLRNEFHRQLFEECVRMRSEGVPNMADKDSSQSVGLALGMTREIGLSVRAGNVTPQAVGSRFAATVCSFLESAFQRLNHLRPGEWTFSTAQGPDGIAKFSQYAHLATIERLLTDHPELRSSLGGDYLIKPDIVVSRKAVSDTEINRPSPFVDASDQLARFSPLRERNVPDSPGILHATISVKWSMRSDRAQNTRTEALNVIRNRKGGTPRIVVVTMEPLPSRLASIAMGTGDIDCCYHAGLEELLHAAKTFDLTGSEEEILLMLIEGNRLRDISDLPFDLAI